MPDFPSQRLVAIGAVHYDTIAHGRETICRDTSTPARFTAKPGGVATNIARAACRLGVATTLIGAVGADGAAAFLKELLAAEGLDLAFQTRSGCATGQYLALHDPDGSLAAACVDDQVLSEAPAGFFAAALAQELQRTAPAPLWLLDANLPEPMLHALVQQIRSSRPEHGGVLTANAVSNAKAPRLKGLLAELDCLTLNRGEAAALTGLADTLPADTLANALTQQGLKAFVLTDGGREALVSSGGVLHRLTPPKTAIVDVTGAGDALTAGILAALARGHGLLTAARCGLQAATLTLQSTGALAEGLRWDQIQRFDHTDKL